MDGCTKNTILGQTCLKKWDITLTAGQNDDKAVTIFKIKPRFSVYCPLWLFYVLIYISKVKHGNCNTQNQFSFLSKQINTFDPTLYCD